MGVFRTEAGRERVRARYAEILGQFPVEQKYVATPQGLTFAIEAGAKDAPPVVLLHGSCGNSAFWLGDVFALSGRFRVLAVDLVGEAGNSDENRYDPASDAYALWLEAALDALDVSRAALVGNSLGGYLALKFAALRPERVAKLALIGASGIVPPSALFDSGSLKTAVSDPDGRKVLGEAVAEGAPLPGPVAEFLRLIAENFEPMTDPLPVFPDEALAGLEMPVFFATGALDVTMDARAAVERVLALVPRAEAALLEGQGHIVMNIAETALPFLEALPVKHITGESGGPVALVDRWARLTNARDMLDALANASFSGCSRMIVHAGSLGDAFFDLKTGIAGEILQKFSNYRMPLAIVGDFSKYKSRSLRDFIRESNRGGAVRFVDSEAAALGKSTGGL